MASEDTRKTVTLEVPGWHGDVTHWRKDARGWLNERGSLVGECDVIRVHSWVAQTLDALHAAQSQLAETTAALGRAREALDASRFNANAEATMRRSLEDDVERLRARLDAIGEVLARFGARYLDMERVERWLSAKPHRVLASDHLRPGVRYILFEPVYARVVHAAPTIAALGAALREAEQAKEGEGT